MKKLNFYEFFAGGGMARMGLGEEWNCLFANDFSPLKAESYARNFGKDELVVGDVFDIQIDDLPRGADLAWASFPCQDLSLAGNGAGLEGKHSAAFFGFWRLMEGLAARGTPVPVVVLENVVGTISSRNGQDFRVLLEALHKTGYSFGPLVMNAAQFVPQSRPRLFIVAVHSSCHISTEYAKQTPDPLWHPKSLVAAYGVLPKHLKEKWLWWNLPYPAPREQGLLDVLLDDDDPELEWHSQTETDRLIQLMNPRHREALEKAKLSKKRRVGAIYRRIRSVDGVKSQFAEMRLDDVSGCLRTGSGGSSKQFLLIVEGKTIRSRRLAAREAARLMGLPDSYRLPLKYGDAYHLIGDGVAVPVVEWLTLNILAPLLSDEPNNTSIYRKELGTRQPALLESKRIQSQSTSWISADEKTIA